MGERDNREKSKEEAYAKALSDWRSFMSGEIEYARLEYIPSWLQRSTQPPILPVSGLRALPTILRNYRDRGHPYACEPVLNAFELLAGGLGPADIDRMYGLEMSQSNVIKTEKSIRTFLRGRGEDVEIVKVSQLIRHVAKSHGLVVAMGIESENLEHAYRLDEFLKLVRTELHLANTTSPDYLAETRVYELEPGGNLPVYPLVGFPTGHLQVSPSFSSVKGKGEPLTMDSPGAASIERGFDLAKAKKGENPYAPNTLEWFIADFLITLKVIAPHDDAYEFQKEVQINRLRLEQSYQSSSQGFAIIIRTIQSGLVPEELVRKAISNDLGGFYEP